MVLSYYKMKHTETQVLEYNQAKLNTKTNKRK